MRNTDSTRFDIALPCFLTIVTMPFTYSIANGIGVGFVSWVVLAAASGKAKAVHPPAVAGGGGVRALLCPRTNLKSFRLAITRTDYKFVACRGSWSLIWAKYPPGLIL